LGKSLNGGAPVDPVNNFVTCGKCADGTLCMDDKTCADRKLSDTQCKGGWMDNGVWKFDPNIDPKSCWNTQKSEFLCPKYRSSNPFSVSRLYQYRSFAGGSQYELASEFEVRPMTASQLDWWSPPLPEVMHRCVTPNTLGRYCTNSSGQPDDKLCRKCSNPANCKVCKDSGLDCTSDSTVCKGTDTCIDYPAVSGACQPFGGTFKYANICTNQAYAENGICGDGVKNTAAKNCSVSLQPCSSDSDCAPNGGYCMGELCELGETQSVKCATNPSLPNNLDGHRLQTCVACTKFDTDPQHPQCVPDVKCGNGRIDKRCAGTNQGCMSNADCTMGLMCINAEACDDGVLNGTYGHCAVGCGGFGGFCGNAQLDAGETCDKGVQNGTWSSQMNPATCSLDCRGVGPYCGDQTIQQPNEECDGQTETTQKAICQGTSILCETNADCPTGKICGSPITVAKGGQYSHEVALERLFDYFTVKSVSAVDIQSIQSPSNLLYQQKLPSIIKSFNDPFWQNLQVNTTLPKVTSIPPGQTLEYVNSSGQKVIAGPYADCKQLFVEQTDGGKRPTQHVRNCISPGTTSSCKWDEWTACVPIGVCGDGVKEPNEECDDGANNGDTKACTKLCKKNVCGDGKLNVGVEECDNGFQNGQPTCNADYNSSCLSCNLGCKFMASAGGYCGDKIRNGPEQCDGTDGLKPDGVSLTCGKLGYDYGTVKCANSCEFTGCTRCSDVVGDGVIAGRVWDAVFLQVVPNARVTLMYKGVKVDEVFSDTNGTFGFDGLNKNLNCNSYKIVVDMYEDNACTTNEPIAEGTCHKGVVPEFMIPYNLDEGVLGGYHPFTSELFSHGNFGEKIPNGDVYLFPRPEKGKAYVALNWIKNDRLDFPIQTVLPVGFTIPGSTGNENEKDYYPCNYDDRPTSDGHHCTRSVNPWRGNRGNWDLSKPPYTQAICLHRAGELLPGWSYNPATENNNDNCPVEGRKICLDNLNKEKGTNYTMVWCSTRTNADCAQCGADIDHANPFKKGGCSAEPRWEECRGVTIGPITSYVNYVPFGNKQIDFYYWGWPSHTNFSSIVTGNQYSFKAYLAVGDSFRVISKPSGSGHYWHIAKLDTGKGEFTPINALGSATVSVSTNVLDPILPSNIFRPAGVSYWNYLYQGGCSWCYKGNQEKSLTCDKTCPAGESLDPADPTKILPSIPIDWHRKVY
jgi:hypothetical protein